MLLDHRYASATSQAAQSTTETGPVGSTPTMTASGSSSSGSSNGNSDGSSSGAGKLEGMFGSMFLGAAGALVGLL
ncbi:hypothetical protein OE88DRAFT_1665007 [Heliocybe sulcata]|uniref:Uncharacterized protein n=1 Tax=Heliocybe sulcata TaxID=5364 RepID=A0A5C3MSH7_9AGAM|nr:hypothetical protein OE88DRAFT_1665007 [Heliocybe sulcata]